MMARTRSSKQARPAPARPPLHNWHSDDASEIERRRQRGQEEQFQIGNLEPGRPMHWT
jgi:hypothetical protein